MKMMRRYFLAIGVLAALATGVYAAGLESPSSGGATGDATAANQTTTNTNLGAPGATACATDTGSCSLNALLQRLANRLTTINTTLGSPFQAGGSIGNTSFAATNGMASTSVNGTTAAITDTTSTQVLASAGGSTRNYVMHCKVTNSHATVGTFVKILDGSTIIDEGYAAAAGGGWSTSYPASLKGTAATAVNCQPVTTGANVICSCGGYTGT